MLLAILSDALIACVCAFGVIYSVCFLFYHFFLPKSAEPFSLDRFFDVIRTFDQEEEK